MQRLCIYMTYNPENKIKPYIKHILKQISNSSTDIYLVCNYLQRNDAERDVESWCKAVIHRENFGYDVGAYKDTLLFELGWEKVSEYDEVMLVNDSFFGFFYDVRGIIDQMSASCFDYWGLSGQKAGFFSNPTYVFDAHIHSYFLVFKKQVITSRVFRDYFEKVTYPTTFRDAIVGFEIEINRCLKNAGFQAAAITDQMDIELFENVNPFLLYPFELLSKIKFPIVKKKAFLIRNSGFDSTLKLIEYVRENIDYPIEWLESFLDCQFALREDGINSLEVFVKSHKYVYFYGYGICGRNLFSYFNYKGWTNVAGIIDSHLVEAGILSSTDSLDCSDDVGIIITTVNSMVSKEIMDSIKNRFKDNNIFKISDCSAIKIPV